MNKPIDLRSDTVTRPSEAMRKAMYEAEVGDDVFKEDPTVNALEEYAADLLGKEAALFVPSGVMGNQICLNILTSPGDEVICEKDSHIFNYESGSPAKISGISLYPVDGVNGIMEPDKVEEAIRPADAYYMPVTKVIEIENTHNRAGGVVIPLGNIIHLEKLARKYNLFFHLDGARIWNASAATGIAAKDYAKHFDTVSCCLSKGLGAPVGSIIASTKENITKAFRVRKGLGGGMRQVGILAAAGLYALKNNMERMVEDQIRAKKIADALAQSKNISIDMDAVQTNIVIFKALNMSVDEAINKCKEKGLMVSSGRPGTVRIITHLDLTDNDIDKAISIIGEVF